MATQEERVATLEQKFATFQKDIAASIREIDENSTIMLGVMRHQGQDIKRTFERLETIDTRLDRIDTRLDRVENVLAQILARLPEKP